MFARVALVLLVGLTPIAALSHLGTAACRAVVGQTQTSLRSQTAPRVASRSEAGLSGFVHRVGVHVADVTADTGSRAGLLPRAAHRTIDAPRELEVKWAPSAAQTEAALTILRAAVKEGAETDLFGAPAVLRAAELPPALDVYLNLSNNLGVSERRLRSGRLRLRLRRATDKERAFASLEYKRDDAARGVLDREEFESEPMLMPNIQGVDFDKLVNELSQGDQHGRLAALLSDAFARPEVEPVLQRVEQVYGVAPRPETMRARFASVQTNEVFDLFRPGEQHLDRSQRIAEISRDRVETFGLERSGKGRFDEFEFELATHFPDDSSRAWMDSMTETIEVNLGIAEARSTMSKYDRSREVFGLDRSGWRSMIDTLRARLTRD